MAIDNLFFDLDGTLADSLPGIAYSVQAAFTGSHRQCSLENVKPLLGPPIRGILRRLAGSPSEAELDALESKFRESYDSVGWQRTACYEGVEDVLAELWKQGKRLFVVTNKPLHATVKIIDFLAIGRFFSDIIARNSTVPAFASKADMLRALVARRRLDPRCSLMVGDCVDDVEAAAAVGMRMAVAMYGYGEPALESSKPERYRLDRFTDLLSLCAREAGA